MKRTLSISIASAVLFGWAVLKASAVYPPSNVIDEKWPPQAQDVLERLREDELRLAGILTNLEEDQRRLREILAVAVSSDTKHDGK